MAKENYSNSRVMHYICEDCDLLYVVHCLPRYREEKNDEIVLANSLKRFTTQNVKQVERSAEILLDFELRNM